jgi:hypothetical protein
MSQAFHNDVTVRSNALARLSAAIDAGRLNAGHVAWSEKKCSAVGALIESDDLDAWEATMGLPAWFALVLETAVGGMREPAQALALATDLLNAIPAGIDMDRVGSALIVHLLQDVAASIAPSPLSPELSAVMQEIISLHLESLAGEQVSPADWRTVRRMATSMTDNMVDPLEKEVARCVESAAWDPLRSRTAVLDTLRQWNNAYRIKDGVNSGWGPAEDAIVQKQLDDINARYVVNAPEPKPNVFDLYEQHHPEDAAALRAHMAKQREDQWRLAGMAGPMLLTFLTAKQGTLQAN